MLRGEERSEVRKTDFPKRNLSFSGNLVGLDQTSKLLEMAVNCGRWSNICAREISSTFLSCSSRLGNESSPTRINAYAEKTLKVADMVADKKY